MKHISHSKVAQFMGESYWVNAKKSGLYTKILAVILGQLEAMLNAHNKVLLVRVDLHQTEYTDSSKTLTKLFRQLGDHFKSTYNMKRFGYVWVREQERAKSQHYHCFLLVDGNKLQTAFKITDKIRWYWEVLNDGSIHWPQPKCYYLIRRGDRETLQEAIYHISYLAKARGKGYKPAQAKDYGASRIKTG